MSKIKFRLAKPSDAKQIASCHWHVRDRYTEGIFLSLGKGFLTAYYEVILDDPNEIVVCAENEEGRIVGFSSGTLDAASQSKRLRQNVLKLGFWAMIGVIQHPSFMKGVLQRYKSLKDDEAPQFVHTEGPRTDYLCWEKGEPNSIAMMSMEKVKLNIMYEFGVREVYFETDQQNERLYKYYLRDKSVELVHEYQIPDGRIRGLFKRVLTK